MEIKLKLFNLTYLKDYNKTIPHINHFRLLKMYPKVLLQNLFALTPLYIHFSQLKDINDRKKLNILLQI